MSTTQPMPPRWLYRASLAWIALVISMITAIALDLCGVLS